MIYNSTEMVKYSELLKVVQIYFAIFSNDSFLHPNRVRAYLKMLLAFQYLSDWRGFVSLPSPHFPPWWYSVLKGSLPRKPFKCKKLWHLWSKGWFHWVVVGRVCMYFEHWVPRQTSVPQAEGSGIWEGGNSGAQLASSREGGKKRRFLSLPELPGREEKFRATFLVNEILLRCDCHLCHTVKMVGKRADAHFVQFIVIPYGI